MRVIQPLKLQQLEDSRCGRCGTATAECVKSVALHSCFLSLCCGHLLFLYLPRMSCIADLILTLYLYTTLRYWREDVNSPEFNMQKSVVDVVCLDCIRCLLLWCCFAYRYQREASNTALKVALGIMFFCMVFVTVKIFILPSAPFLLWFSLIAASVEVGLFALVRYYEAKTVSHGILHTKDNDGHLQKQKYQPLRNVGYADLESQNRHVDEDSENESHNSPSLTASPSHRQRYPPSPPIIQDPRDLLKSPSSQFVTIYDVNVHYSLDYGEGSRDAPALVLLHGFGGGVFCWRRSIDHLKAFSSIILAFDRPGFGLTSRPSSLKTCNPYSVEFSVLLLERIMSKHGVSKAIIVAHSSGALVAYHMARSYPKKVTGLCLVSPSPHGMPMFVRQILKTSLARPIILNLIRSEISHFTLWRAWHDPDKVDPKVFAAYRAPLSLPNWEESLVQMTRIKPLENILDVLKAITCKVVVLHGSDDKIVRFRESEEICRAFPAASEATLVRILDCGHLPFEELPEQFARHVRAFVDVVTQGKGSLLPTLAVEVEVERSEDVRSAPETEKLDSSQDEDDERRTFNLR